MTTITMKNIRDANLCASGAREFFKRHGLDWNKFLADGIDVSEVAHIDDDFCKAVIASAERDEQSEVGK